MIKIGGYQIKATLKGRSAHALGICLHAYAAGRVDLVAVAVTDESIAARRAGVCKTHPLNGQIDFADSRAVVPVRSVASQRAGSTGRSNERMSPRILFSIRIRVLKSIRGLILEPNTF
jgi:hypothetical protein